MSLMKRILYFILDKFILLKVILDKKMGKNLKHMYENLKHILYKIIIGNCLKIFEREERAV